MDEIETKNKNLTPSPPVPFDMRLGSLRSSRQTLARLIREWGKGTISEESAKTGTWLMSAYLGFLKLESSEDIEKRLAAIEKALERKNDESGD